MLRAFNRKRLISLLILFSILFFVMPSFQVFAATDAVKDETFSGAEFQSKMEKAMDEANIFERFIYNMVNSVFKLSGLSPITELIYGNPYQYWIADHTSKLVYGLFYEKEVTELIEPVINIFVALYSSFVLISILISSLKMGVLRPHSPQAVSDFYKDLQMWVVSAIFMFSFWDIINILTEFNMGFVQAIDSLLASKGISTNGISIVGTVTSESDSKVFGLGDIIILLGEWVLGVVLNFIYLSRKFAIIILIFLSPLVAYSLLYARTRTFFSVWLKEICGNIFLQSLHALIMYAVAVMASLGASSVVKLLMLCLFIPLSGLLSKLLSLGDSSSKLGQTLTLSGFSSAAGMLALARGAKSSFGGVGGKSSAPSSPNSNPASDPLKGPSSSDYSPAGITHRPDNTMNRSLGMARTAASITGATIGTLAGMVAGPGGAVVGGMVGYKMGAAPVKMAESFGKGAANTFNSIKDYNEYRKTADPNDLTGQRFHKGQIGASVGQMFGGDRGASLGKKVGIGFSGVTRRSAAIQQFGGKSLADIAASNPDREFFQKIDSQKSGFYTRDENGEEKLVSVLGSGLPGLKNPVYVDYRTPKRDSTVTQNGNGTYSMSTSGGAAAAGFFPPTNNRDAGLKGSTPHMLRTSEAYTKDANGNRYEYRDYDASKTDPSSYFMHGAEGLTTGSFAGRVYDKMRGEPSASEQAKRNAYNQKLSEVAAEEVAKRSTRKKAIP